MKSTWTEFCSNLQQVTAPKGQKAAIEFLELIDPLYESYKHYDIKKVNKVAKEYICAGRILEPQVEDADAQTALAQVLDLCEALYVKRDPNMDKFNKFIIKAHTIVVNALYAAKQKQK